MTEALPDKLKTRVTLVALTRNVERYIRKDLESLKMQDCEPKEIWVVDGGSTDGTIEIAKELADRVFVTEPGFGVAREKARRESTSEYLFFSDGDKYLTDRETVSKLIAKMELNHNLAACQAAWAVDPVDLKHSLVARVEQFRYERFYRKVVDRSTRFITPCGSVFRASVLRAVGGFTPEIKWDEDTDISLKLLDAGYDLMVTSAATVFHHCDDSFSELMRKAFRGGKDYYYVWKRSGDSAWPLIASSNPINALARGIKTALAALIETKDVVLTSFAFAQVFGYYTFFFLGFLARLITSNLGSGRERPS